MCCSLQYKEGPRTIIVQGFPNVYSAVRHANSNGIDNYDLRVQPDLPE